MSAGRGSWKWWMCGALLLATMLNYMDRQTLSLTATQLKDDIRLDDGRYGSLEEWFSYAFAAGGIFFGFVADRIGPRKLYPAILTGWSIAGIATPLASWPTIANAFGDPGDPGLGEFRWLFICRTVLGFCEAGHWPCALLTARNILSDEQRPLGNSILQSGASLGAILTPLVIQAIRWTGLPWQAPFFIIGIVGLIWVPIWIVLIRSGDLTYRRATKTGNAEAFHLGRFAFQIAALSVIVVTISLAWQFQRAWLPKYLKEVHWKQIHHREMMEDPEATKALIETKANYFTSGYYITADVGCLFFGAVVSVLTRWRMNVRAARLISFTGCVLLVALSAIVPMMPRGPLLLVCLTLVGAGSLGAHPQYYALVQELPSRHMGLLSGLLAATSWVAVGRMQGAMGAYIKETGSYDVPMIVTGLAPIAGLIAMAALVAFRPKSSRGEVASYS
jgi:ACS family hexuronate transporter-like MFS transporter